MNGLDLLLIISLVSLYIYTRNMIQKLKKERTFWKSECLIREQLIKEG